MPSNSISIGNVKLNSVTYGYGSGLPTDVFPESTKSEWVEYPELLDAEGNIHPRFGATIISMQNKLIAVDTGFNAPDGRLLDEMYFIGLTPKDVDFVVLTHLHPDHVGWNMSNGEPTFPNARYLVSKRDFNYWTSPEILSSAQHIHDFVLPLKELEVLKLIEGNFQITDELHSIPTPGHTPGHISIVVSSNGNDGFVLGDVAHSPAQAHHTDWNPAFDIDPDLARETRHNILDTLEKDNSIVSAGHFPAPGFGRFVRDGGKRIWKPI